MFSHRNMGSEANITLVENGLVLNEKIEVANVFNKYFVSVAKQIGECDELEYGDNITDIIQTHATHQSVGYIRQNLGLREIEFTPVEQDQVFEKLKKLNERKATGHDGISPKLIKMVALELSTPFT